MLEEPISSAVFQDLLIASSIDALGHLHRYVDPYFVPMECSADAKFHQC
jgi:hypothetical protein